MVCYTLYHCPTRVGFVYKRNPQVFLQAAVGLLIHSVDKLLQKKYGFCHKKTRLLAEPRWGLVRFYWIEVISLGR